MKLRHLLPLMIAWALLFGVFGAAHLMNQSRAKDEARSLLNEQNVYKERLNSPIPMWKCGDAPNIVPKRENYQDIKVFHMAVADFRAQSYAWMECATDYVYLYPFAVKDWGEQLIKENEVIIQ